MQSKWVHLKENAIHMRKAGSSLRHIAEELGIAKSTLSGWFREITLTVNQASLLETHKQSGLKNVRIKATLWHRQQKILRVKQAKKLAINLLRSVNIQDKTIQQLALAMLYLGDGFKKNQELGFVNSNPLILKFFIDVYLINFAVDIATIKCELYLRADQNEDEMKLYWSHALQLPTENFTYVHFDQRTSGIETYENYKGVCALRCGNVAVKRKLLYIAEIYCKKVALGRLAQG